MIFEDDPQNFVPFFRGQTCVNFRECTPGNLTNVPKHRQSQKESSLPIIIFQGASCQISGMFLPRKTNTFFPENQWFGRRTSY